MDEVTSGTERGRRHLATAGWGAGRGAEWAAVALVLGLVVLAFAAEPLGWWGGNVHQWLPPMSAHQDAELHGLFALPVAVAAASVAYGPRLAETLRWSAVVGLT